MVAVKVALVFCIIQATAMAIKTDTRLTVLNLETVKAANLADIAYFKSFAKNLQEVQNNTGNIAASIGQDVTHVLSEMDKAVKEAEVRINRTFQNVEIFVKTFSKAEDECVYTATPLDNATLGFQTDAVDCLQKDVNSAITIGEKAIGIEYKINQLKEDTQHTMYTCSLSNALSNGLCWTEHVPALLSRTVELAAEAKQTVVDSLNIIPILIVKSEVCTAIALAKRSEQAANIVKVGVKCFNNHLRKD